ncbi:MAG: hypothetical protein WCG93_07535 [Paludibacter sp.]
MKYIKILFFLFAILQISCKTGEPNPPYSYEANPHYVWGYAEFYGAYYANQGIKISNNTISISLFSDSLKLTKSGALVGYGQYLFLEDVFVSPLTTKLIIGKYTINETGNPFTVFAGKNDTIDSEVYSIGAYVTYYEQNTAKSKIKLISKGFLDVKMINDSVYNIVCDFKTSDSLQLKGRFEAVLPYFDQSLAPKKVGSRNRFKLNI